MINQFYLTFVVMTVRTKIDNEKNKSRNELIQPIFVNVVQTKRYELANLAQLIVLFDNLLYHLLV